MAKRLSMTLVHKGLRDIGVTTFAGSFLAIVLDKGHSLLALSGMLIGLTILLVGCVVGDKVTGDGYE